MEDREIRILQVKESILADNDADADRLRLENQAAGTFYMNLMSSPGAGKTTLLLGTIARLKEILRIGVMEADIDSDVDARKIQAAGVPAIQIHTGGMCHLDADMSRQGLRELGISDLDLVILENVGNLVCPAEFDTGAALNTVLLSVPEGDDKPLKYPLMFRKADVVLVTKTDALPAFDFDMERFTENVRMRSPEVPVFAVSARTGEGMEAWCEWLADHVRSWHNAHRQ